jgi:hypothetical protein
MPRKKRALTATSAAAKFSAKESHVLLRKLQELGHVTAAHLHSAREAVADEVQSLMARLQELKADAVALPAAVRAVRRARATTEKSPVTTATPIKVARPTKVSAERRKIMQLQGRYLGLMHKVPKAELAKFKAMIPKVGKEVVVQRMESYVRKHGAKAAVKPLGATSKDEGHAAASKKK